MPWKDPIPKSEELLDRCEELLDRWSNPLVSLADTDELPEETRKLLSEVRAYRRGRKERARRQREREKAIKAKAKEASVKAWKKQDKDLSTAEMLGSLAAAISAHYFLKK